jgi:molybdopterin molybdotransferase
MSDFLPVAVVLDNILSTLSPITQCEEIRLGKALHRILARDVICPVDVPPHPNSAMDGYAFLFADQPPKHAMKVRGTVLAGQVPDCTPSPTETTACIRIMTGGALPPHYDTVVPQEHCLLQDGHVVLQLDKYPLKRGENTRARGEDLRKGEPALTQGRRLTAADIGLLASLGLSVVTVAKRLRVAVLSTGDELVAPGQALDAGKIYDSNRFTLIALLDDLGVDVLDLGIVRDDPKVLEDALRHAVANLKVDAIISSGGVSVGEADFTKTVMAKLGEVNFWQIAMRPGRPLAFGHLGHTLFFGLPGNPVAVMMTYLFFARPALLALQGARDPASPMFMARSLQAIRKKPGRTEYQRAQLTICEKGEATVELTGQQGSGVLSSMSRANCLVVLPHEQGNVSTGDQVLVAPFNGLL